MGQAILRLTGLLLCASAMFGQTPSRALRALGEFSNMRLTEEHAYGQTVQLWRDGETLVGLLLVSEGLQGDTPTGLLENVKFDARTGALSFRAKLTVGSRVLAGGKQEPTRDLYEFAGTLKARELSGTLTLRDPRGSTDAHAERVTWKKGAAPLAYPAADSYATWKREVDEILKVRGPKW